MNFSEQPPSKQWAALKYRGDKFAEVWFKPEGEPLALRFRILPTSFQVSGMSLRLTPESLLKAVGVATEEVESWRCEGAAPSDMDGVNAELSCPLPPPREDIVHLTLHVRLKPPQPMSPAEDVASEIPASRWQDLEARWHAILGLEASLETLRVSMESLRGELESSSRRTLTPDERVHALNADVAQWNKAKSRVLFALPKAKEFIHRSTWATGTPERKELEEVVKNHIRPRIAFSRVNQVAERLDSLLKDRQVLSAHGTSVYQECKGILAELQGTLRTLQSNAVANASRKKNAPGGKGKPF